MAILPLTQAGDRLIRVAVHHKRTKYHSIHSGHTGVMIRPKDVRATSLS